MKQTILLIGRTGQIGSHLCPLLGDLGEVVAPTRNELDLSNASAIRRIVRHIRPHVIVNAAAYTSVDAAETDEECAHAINAIAPGVFAEECKRIAAKLVHYSTDYVFDGAKATPYQEGDSARPVNVYGKTKLAGEEAIRNSNIPHIIFRTSWVYAMYGTNFLIRVLRLATEKKELRVVKDQIGAPTWAREIARNTMKVLKKVTNGKNDDCFLSKESGTYHMTAAGQTSWYEFAIAILDEARRVPQNASWYVTATDGRPLITRQITAITTEEYPTPASRPAYSVLSNSLLSRTFGVKMLDWRTQLRLCFVADQRK